MINTLEAKTSLETKNNIVLSLRNHLTDLYQTNHHYTFGEGNFEGKKENGAYISVRRDINKQRDITGFCFRKDLCNSFDTPDTKDKLFEDIYNFLKQKDIEIEPDSETMKLSLSGKRYLITGYVDEGYAGEISVIFIQRKI